MQMNMHFEGYVMSGYTGILSFRVTTLLKLFFRYCMQNKKYVVL